MPEAKPVNEIYRHAYTELLNRRFALANKAATNTINATETLELATVKAKIKKIEIATAQHNNF